MVERTVGKFKKPRKPMSEKNRIQAAERLREAREKRLRENPPKYTNIHPSVRELPDDHPLSRKRVTSWIKTQKGLLSAARTAMRNQSQRSGSRVLRNTRIHSTLRMVSKER